MEITAKELIELVEDKESWKCTAIDLESERDTLKEQIKVLKEMILEKCFLNYPSGQKVTDYYVKEDIAKFSQCGITLEDVRSYVNCRLAEENKDE